MSSLRILSNAELTDYLFPSIRIRVTTEIMLISDITNSAFTKVLYKNAKYIRCPFQANLTTLFDLSRRTLSQIWGFKIRRTTFLNYVKFADLLILRL